MPCLYEDHPVRLIFLIAPANGGIGAVTACVFLLDNDVPDAVRRVLMEAGYDVLLLRDVLPKKSSDPAVSITQWQTGCC